MLLKNVSYFIAERYQYKKLLIRFLVQLENCSINKCVSSAKHMVGKLYHKNKYFSMLLRTYMRAPWLLLLSFIPYLSVIQRFTSWITVAIPIKVNILHNRKRNLSQNA